MIAMQYKYQQTNFQPKITSEFKAIIHDSMHACAGTGNGVETQWQDALLRADYTESKARNAPDKNQLVQNTL